MKKRGFLLAEETLKMILALISIGILAFLLFSLYGSRQDAANLKFATESLNYLVQEIEAGATQVEIYNPEGWWLISWPYEEKLPNACSNLGWESCLCIIDKSLSSFGPDGYSEDSDDGVCLEISKKVVVNSLTGGQGPIKIVDPPLILSIDRSEEITLRKA
ncbi:MAG: hypothetical protein KKB79_01335 [Nanoarchaeota archaeon]|nr:hypothetical protein [Nanoarchaeota archaeon]